MHTHTGAHTHVCSDSNPVSSITSNNLTHIAASQYIRSGIRADEQQRCVTEPHNEGDDEDDEDVFLSQLQCRHRSLEVTNELLAGSAESWDQSGSDKYLNDGPSLLTHNNKKKKVSTSSSKFDGFN